MFDVNDDAKGGFRRVEVLTGPGRRRRWSAAEKARIVDEAAQPGVRVSDVARRWQVCSQQIFGWRREARAGMAIQSSAPAFVPIVSEAAPLKKTQRLTPATPSIEIELSDAVVRVASCADDGALLTAVLRAVRASAISA
jgi:transposase